MGWIKDFVKNPGRTVKNVVSNPANLLPGSHLTTAIRDAAGINLGNFGGGGGGGGGGIYVDPGPRPELGEYRGIGARGVLRDTMESKRKGWQLMQDEATRTGPSAWRQAEQTRQIGALGQQGQGRLTQGMNQLAMQGGLRGGAGERMALQNMRQQLTGGQDIRSQLGAQDANRQWQAQQLLPGVEEAESRLRMDQKRFNIERLMKENELKNLRDMARYNEGMRGWAAIQTANAMPVQSSGGGGILDFLGF